VTPVPILLTRLSGVHRDQQMARDAIDAPPLRRARERLPWLLIGLAGSALVTVTMAGFDATLASSVAVAFFVPGIVYLADAIGTQTEAAAVRGLSLVHEPLPHLVWGELRTGLLMGITLASIALPAVWLAFGELPLALPVAGALLGPRVGWPPPSAYCSRGCCGERGAVGRIATGLGASTAALHGETTMTVQALDLGLVVPLSVMSAIFAVRRHPLGLAAAAAFCRHVRDDVRRHRLDDGFRLDRNRRSPGSADRRLRDRLFRQFSFPGGIPSHVAPETPGSIHEGGELGYALSHAYGAAFDNPDLLVACVIGDGEAETGPLAASWHANKWVDPRRDGAVLPILHLNGYKIANPTVLARIPEPELRAMLEGFGHTVHFVSRDDPADVHRQMAETLDRVLDEIAAIQDGARSGGVTERARWPMIVLRTPKGWTGPKEIDGKPVEGHWRSHQVPMTDVRENKAHLRILEDLDAQLSARGSLRRRRRPAS